MQRVLICLETSDCIDPLLSVADLLGLTDNARLVGMHTLPGIHYSRNISPNKLNELYVEVERRHRREADQIRQLFVKGTQSLPYESEVKESQGMHVFDYAPYWQAAQFTDVALCAPTTSAVADISLQRDLIVNGGVPVVVSSLTTPVTNQLMLSDCTIRVIWNGLADCARAIKAAKPMLKIARTVEVVVDPLAEINVLNSVAERDMNCLKSFLAREKIRVNVRTTKSLQGNVISFADRAQINFLADSTDDVNDNKNTGAIIVLGASSYFNNPLYNGENNATAFIVSS